MDGDAHRDVREWDISFVSLSDDRKPRSPMQKVANATNEAVRSWLRGGGGDAKAGLLVAMSGQMRSANAVEKVFGLDPRTHGRRVFQGKQSPANEGLRRLLDIYVPEIADPLAESMPVRAAQLHRLAEYLSDKEELDPGASKQYLQELEDAQHALADAAERTRQFIVAHFPLEAKM